MIKIAIIDDSINDISKLCSYLSSYHSQIKIVLNYFTSFDDYLKSTKDYYAIFLDIEIGSKENGIELASYIDKKTKIIYLTNYDSYVFDAAHQSPFDFIRKSYLKEEFSCLMDKLLLTYQNENYLLNFEKPKLSIRVDDILYFESNKNYEYCYLEHDCIKIRITQKELINKLEELPLAIFVKIHKTVIINCNKIKQITSSGTIIMKNGEILPITLRLKKEITNNVLQLYHQQIK